MKTIFLVFAITIPTLLTPSNSSTVSLPNLTWNQVPDSTRYKVYLDNEPTVTSPYIHNTPYYTQNTSYSPQLEPSLYYWKVAAQDSSGNWNFSDIWSFTLINNPSPSPSSVATPAPTPTPTPTPSPSTQTASFTILDIPSQINFYESFRAKIALITPSNPNKEYFLKGAFKKTDGSRYFGLTKKDSNWVEYGDDYSNQNKITVDAQGNWNGTLEVKPDISDTDYKGAGTYIFKVGKFTSNNSPAWSNEAIINILSEPASPSPSASPSPTPTLSPDPSPWKKTLLKVSTPSYKIKFASVSAVTSEATPAAVVVKNQKNVSPLIWAGLFSLFAAISSLGYIYLRKRYG